MPPSCSEVTSAYSPAALTTVAALNRSCGVTISMPSACVSAPIERAGDDDGDVVRLAGVFERLHEGLGFDDAGIRRPQRGKRAHVRLLCP